jgi:hypothetical protein
VPFVMLLLVGGFCIGLALVLRESVDEDRGSNPGEVDKDVRFGAQASDVGRVEEGVGEAGGMGHINVAQAGRPRSRLRLTDG